MSAAILSLDQGTTSSRAIVFGETGTTLASAQREFKQHFPNAGWVEHDAAEIWASQRDVAAEAIATWRTKQGASGDSIAAIGITNQRETTVIWNRQTGKPIAPAIVWQDRRTAGYCDELINDGHQDVIRAKTGLVIDPYFSATKIRWLLKHIAGAEGSAARGELAFGTIDTWLVYNLTEGKIHATDVSNASRTMLFNIQTMEWDDGLLQLFSIPRSILPNIVSSSGLIGETSCDGLPQGIPICSMIGDQQSALFGQGCHSPGLVKNTYGTGCFMLMNTGAKPAPASQGLISTVAWRTGVPPNAATSYALEGSVFIAGAAVQWLRDGLGIINSAREIEALAASVPSSDGVVFVPAFSGLGTPDWDPSARGTLLGLTRGTTRAHIARATLEAIAFQCAELLSAMRDASGISPAELRVDGGGTANNLLMQIQADLVGIPVVRANVQETTALGAARLAGMATGLWSGVTGSTAEPASGHQWLPSISRDEAQCKLSSWRRAVPRAKGWT
ncbi:MAG: glycerol kinase GlpK [Burkholderiales bacterium]|jgi:glycerol kinase|nr:glycerol kinase GlpK [Rhodocyclaceae bacterium]MCA3022065.1 glycerol kinase GlpK [Rhodocyclaceae bacterium]MCA3052539.1 glycerol kinase GlpK [Rhodocyclaceae bacterium]MCA3056500.1 glycerol kinase GlpK [Rhodocyclaceae bacterium]